MSDDEKAYLQELARELLGDLNDTYFRDINLPAKASSFEGVYRWNEIYWEKIDKSEFETICNTILQELNLNNATQKKVLHEFILSLAKKDSELNRFGEHLFCIKSGVLAFSRFVKEDSEIDLFLKKHDDAISTIRTSNEKIFCIPHHLCKEFYITHYSDLDFKAAPDEKAISQFLAFLEKSVDNFDNYKEFLFNLINSFFCGDDSGSFFVNFLGKTQCGKTTLVNFLTELLGEYCDIMGKTELKYDTTEYSYNLYRKRNARLLVYSEPTSNSINSTLIKEITGKTKFKFNNIGYYIRGRLIIDSNYPLTSSDNNDDAFYERYVMIPFGPSISKEERNYTLGQELISHKNDIFSFILQQMSNIAFAETSLPHEEKEHLRLLSNPIQYFYQENCYRTIPGYNITMSQLYNHYLNIFIQRYSDYISNKNYIHDHFGMTQKALNITRKDFEKTITYLHPDYIINSVDKSSTLLEIEFLTNDDLGNERKKMHQEYLRNYTAKDDFFKFVYKDRIARYPNNEPWQHFKNIVSFFSKMKISNSSFNLKEYEQLRNSNQMDTLFMKYFMNKEEDIEKPFDSNTVEKGTTEPEAVASKDNSIFSTSHHVIKQKSKTYILNIDDDTKPFITEVDESNEQDIKRDELSHDENKEAHVENEIDIDSDNEDNYDDDIVIDDNDGDEIDIDSNNTEQTK